MFDGITSKFTGIMRTLSGKGKISEKNVRDAVDEIKEALLDADVNLRVVRRFVNSTLDEALGEKVLASVNPGQQFTKIVYDKMVELLGGTESANLLLKGRDTTSIILLMGLQGSGKTTAAHKLAHRLKKEGRSVMLVADDLVRPAAITQLQVLGEKDGSFKRYRIKPPKGAECAVISFCRRASRISFAPSAPRQEAGASA